MKLEDMPELKPLDRIEIEYFQNDQLKDKIYKTLGYFLDISFEGEYYRQHSLFYTTHLFDGKSGNSKSIYISHITSLKVLQESSQ
ncbi:hypothetical protein J4221_00675 [Candidatus Pacearchaeota archaeon]|nr:hypothetical protein [Candidatus Pacearchaeota archaeon]